MNNDRDSLLSSKQKQSPLDLDQPTTEDQDLCSHEENRETMIKGFLNEQEVIENKLQKERKNTLERLTSVTEIVKKDTMYFSEFGEVFCFNTDEINEVGPDWESRGEGLINIFYNGETKLAKIVVHDWRDPEGRKMCIVMDPHAKVEINPSVDDTRITFSGFESSGSFKFDPRHFYIKFNSSLNTVRCKKVMEEVAGMISKNEFSWIRANRSKEGSASSRGTTSPVFCLDVRIGSRRIHEEFGYDDVCLERNSCNFLMNPDSAFSPTQLYEGIVKAEENSSGLTSKICSFQSDEPEDNLKSCCPKLTTMTKSSEVENVSEANLSCDQENLVSSTSDSLKISHRIGKGVS